MSGPAKYMSEQPFKSHLRASGLLNLN